jgi:uncharacterized damage-inducible protein DinB
MTVDYFRQLFDYNYWAHGKVWACAMRLDEDAYRRPCDYSVGSVHEQLAHTCSAERLWLGRVREDAQPVFPAADTFPDRAALRAAWDALEAEWRAFLNSLDDARLTHVVTYTSINGNRTRHTPIWQALTQILNHGTDHRAQTLALIHQLGGETVAQDYIFYSWE